MANNIKTENIYQSLKTYNEYIYNSLCENQTINDISSIAKEYGIENLIKEKNYRKAALLLNLTDYQFTLDDENFTYEILKTMNILKCSSVISVQLREYEEQQERNFKILLTTLEDYDSDTSDDEGVFLDSYDKYIHFKPTGKDIKNEKKEFINLVTSLIQAKDKITLNYPLRINDKDLLAKIKLTSNHEERVELLTKAFDSSFSKNSVSDLLDIVTFSNAVHPNITRHIELHGGVRQSFWKYQKNTLSWEQNKYFLFLLSLYIGFPEYDDFDYFMKMHGHTLSSPFSMLTDKNGKDIISDLEIKEWLSNGITIKCISELIKKRTSG